MDMINVSYKEFHEQYMSNLNGTSCFETFGIIIPVSLFVFFVCILAITNGNSVSSFKINFLIEFALIVIPTILTFTIFADYSIYMTITLVILCCSIILLKFQEFGIDSNHKDFLNFSLCTKKKSFITNFRSLTNVLTAISILAVDFTIFPRRFAKTETFGYSLMDTGVGLFCVTNSLVTSSRNDDKEKAFFVYFCKTLKSCMPLVILGGIRFFTTTQIDYQMHVSEYGVHWNFFLTLAVSKLFCSLILQLFGEQHVYILSLILIIAHEIIMQNGLQDWVLSDTSRDDFLNANREGIASLLGYIALFIAGISMRNLIYSHSQKVLNLILLDTKCIILSIFFWSVTLYTSNLFQVSRRLANFGYFIWMIAYSLSVLVLLTTVDLMLITLQFFLKSSAKWKSSQLYTNRVPVIFDAVNYNALAFFLIANIFTGLVNISVQTLTMSEVYSILILIFYMLCICTIICILFLKRIKLKVW